MVSTVETTNLAEEETAFSIALNREKRLRLENLTDKEKLNLNRFIKDAYDQLFVYKFDSIGYSKPASPAGTIVSPYQQTTSKGLSLKFEPTRKEETSLTDQVKAPQQEDKRAVASRSENLIITYSTEESLDMSRAFG